MSEANLSLPRAVTGRMLLSTVGGAGVQVQNVNGGGDWLGAISPPGTKCEKRHSRPAFASYTPVPSVSEKWFARAGGNDSCCGR